MALNCFEEIFNNYLKASYLSILSKVKKTNVALNIIYKAVEKVFMMDYHLGNLLNIKEKLSRYVLMNEKIYISNNKNEIENIDIKDIDTTIPDELYVLNFNIYKIFNEIDNQIIIDILIFRKDMQDLIVLLNFDEEYIVDRYKSILKYTKTMFTEVVKPVFEKLK